MKFWPLYESGVPESLSNLNPVYREVRSRAIAVCEIVDGAARLVVGHRWRGITLTVLFKELDWRYRREHGND